MTTAVFALAVVLAVTLLYVGHGYWAWVSPVALVLAAWAAAGIASPIGFAMVTAIAVAAAAVFGVPYLRRALISARAMGLLKSFLPRMGDTERIALEAGTVWWDGDLFSGNPDWQKLLDFRPRPLSEREQAFLDGPVEELCAMVDDWEIYQRRDLPPEVWSFLKQQRFFGMIIPEEYGGLGFSAIAHSAVVAKVSSRSVPTAITLMVPNSLGPAELLLHYGTDDQKRHYLPRLATGDEVPCFALTEPEAGSDAASTQSKGIVCRGEFDGREVTGMRLDWCKRYITLAPVATVVGLAFRLYDPEGLLGGEQDLGITCALIPADLPGIEIGDRHDPMGVPFQNGPIFGHNVFVPIDFVIGGREGIGQGWRMLMECLAVGRSISLPALSVAAAELAARAVGAYATIREQFNTPIGRFEGIEEPLARIGGYTYLMNAARVLICGAVDDGEKPAVLSAIVKAYLTEGMRTVIGDAMDIRAGAGICRGPRNIVGRGFVAAPIGITVEGANILTRSLIIFGQGAIRSHPYVHEVMDSVSEGNLERFDHAFFGYVGFVFGNVVRSFFLGITGGRLAAVPVSDPTARHFRSLTRFSSAFALVSDTALATLGGAMKRREKISGRLADALAWLYLGSAALKRFHDEGRPQRDRAVLDWSCALAAWNIQEALRGVLDNLPNRVAAAFLRPIVFPLGARLRPAGDALGADVARGLLDGNELRLHLTSDIFLPRSGEPGLGRLEAALDKVVAAQAAQAKIRKAARTGVLVDVPREGLVAAALAKGVISGKEGDQLREADEARDEVIQVDVFDPETYRSLKG